MEKINFDTKQDDLAGLDWDSDGQICSSCKKIKDLKEQGWTYYEDTYFCDDLCV